MPRVTTRTPTAPQRMPTTIAAIAPVRMNSFSNGSVIGPRKARAA